MIEISKIKIGMTRDEVMSILGEPDDVGGTSKKYKTPCVYVYGDFELSFLPWKTGTLIHIQYYHLKHTSRRFNNEKTSTDTHFK